MFRGLFRHRRTSPLREAEVKHKYEAELSFWQSYTAQTGSEPETEYYRKFMMDMGNIRDRSFFDHKVCLDVGCGPKGSLTWLSNAKAAIGMDPLVEEYRKFGIDRHAMIYLWSTAESIPLPSGYVDVLFSMNSLDHVNNFPRVCSEIRRVLKPHGYFIGSLNLDEPESATEPWTLTESLLDKHLFAGWTREYYEIRPKVRGDAHFEPYKYFYEPCPPEIAQQGGAKALWCRLRVN